MPNRIVVFGSRISGAEGLARRFSEFLEKSNVPNPVVDFERDAAHITDTFFSRSVDSEQSSEDTLPRGVVIFPEMRQYTPSGSGMFIHGHVLYIEKLCEDNNVPFVSLTYDSTPEEVTNQTAKLFVSNSRPALETK